MDILDVEVGLTRDTTEVNIAEVSHSLRQGTQHSPRHPLDSKPLVQAAHQNHLTVVHALLEHDVLVSEQDRLPTNDTLLGTSGSI